MKNTKSVFISYKNQDELRNKWVQKLCSDLKDAGITTILDKYDNRPGKSISHFITNKIKNCDYLLFIITPKAVEAVNNGEGYVAFEVQISNAKKIKKKEDFIIPIYREGEELPFYFSDTVYLDFRKDEEYRKKLSELVYWINNETTPVSSNKKNDVKSNDSSVSLKSDEEDKPLSIELSGMDYLYPAYFDFLREFPELNTNFLGAPFEEQRFILELYRKLSEIFSNNTNESSVYATYIREYFQLIIEKKTNEIRNLGLKFLNDVVLPNHNEFIQIVISKIFRIGYRKVKNIFKGHSMYWRSWDLIDWGRYYYPNWNSNPIYSSILEIPTSILRDLELLGIDKFSLEKPNRKEPEDEDILLVKEIFIRSIDLIKWMEEAKQDILRPVSLEYLEKIFTNPEIIYFEQLSETFINYNELIEIIQKRKLILEQEFDTKTEFLQNLNDGIITINKSSLPKLKKIIFEIIEY